MKILKFWYVPCLIFCLYCLYALVADSYEVLYQKKRNKTDPVQFLACEELSDLYPNQIIIDLKELRGQLYDRFNSSIDKNWRSKFPRRFEKLIRNRTKSGGYLVLNRRVCLIANDTDELRYIYLFLPLKTVFFAIQRNTFDFVRMDPFDQIAQLIVRKKERPYSDCSSSNGRFHCLNECFRRSFRLARYFYHSNETGLIQLDSNDKNRTIQESERNCFGECKRENCKLIQLISVDNESKEPQTFEAQPRLSALDFWVELIGRIFLFVGLFFDQFASIATKLTKSRVRRRKVKIGLFYLNFAIILLSLAYCGYLCVRLVLDLNAEVNDLPEREKTRNLIQPKTVHLAICVRIIEYVDYSFKGKTMSEIERATDEALNDTLEGIYVNYGWRSFRTDYHVHRKILFYFYRRCFSLSTHPNYPTIPSNPMLTVRLKRSFLLYVLSEEENLNSNSFMYSGRFAFQKRIVKRLKSNGRCVNYGEKYANCTGRQNCLERCISRKFMETYNKTTFGVRPYPVIDRDWFSSSEWNTSQLMEIPEDNESIYFNVSRECEEEISDVKPCNEMKFNETVGIQQPDDLTMEIDLQFDVVLSVEEMPSSLKMALDLLSIQSIFFGFTLLQLFWVIYQFIKPKWRVRNDKVVWFLICLLASIGCSWNTIRVNDLIVNGELVPAEHYEMAERVQIPAMVFCLPIDQKLVDRNHKLTGNYLEVLTRNMSTKRMFESIAHLNESNEWTTFNLSRVEWFFFQNMKCFRIDIGQVYDRNQFHFSNDRQVLRVNFNRTKKNRLVYFMTQSNETAEFSKILNLDYSLDASYSITHEASLCKYKDRFGFFRRHFPSFQEGDVGDLHEQLLELQGNEHSLRTLNVPMEKEDFDSEVNEDLFEQLYSVQKQKGRNERTNLNYQQTFNLVFLRKVVHSTNEVNYATLTLSLLNLLPIWLELGVLDLRPFLVRFHDHLLVYLYLHLPIYLLRKLIKALFFCSKWLKKLKPPLYELIDPLLEEEDSPDDSSTSDQSSVTSVA